MLQHNLKTEFWKFWNFESIGDRPRQPALHVLGALDQVSCFNSKQ